MTILTLQKLPAAVVLLAGAVCLSTISRADDSLTIPIVPLSPPLSQLISSSGDLTDPGTPPIAPSERAPLSDDEVSVVASDNNFALSIFQQLTSDSGSDGNLLISPFSISTALAMTYAGARGETAQQMANVLAFTLPDDRLHVAYGQLISDLTTPRDGYQLNLANRLFGEQGFPFNQSFLDTTANDYGAPLEPLNFSGAPDGSRNTINQWVANQTNNKIQNLLPPGSVDSSTRLVLTNAIYFNGQWNSKFDTQQTRNQAFYQANGSQTSASMMHQVHDFQYAQMPGFQVLQMPYAGDDLSMVIMLPNERDGLASMEHSLTDDMWKSTLSSLRNTLVNVSMPKFSFDSSFQLAGVLEQMGMTDAFSSAADFSGITPAGKLDINSVIHQAFIDVSEQGTEAAAATGVGLVASSVYEPIVTPVDFTADHPFLFALEDDHSGSILFLGQVTNPASLTAVPEPSAAVLMAVGAALLFGCRRLKTRQSAGLRL
jgi:serpin B